MLLEFIMQRYEGLRGVCFGAPLHPANPQNTPRRLLIPLSGLCLSAFVSAAPVPVPGDAPVPVDRLRLGNTNVLAMTGTWRFNLDHGISPAVRGELPADTPVPDFATTNGTDAGWTNILVPANWEIEGFSTLTYQERTGRLSEDIGLYRRWVDIPANFAGQTVLWHFDGAYDGAEVFVNGQRCGYHESGFTAFDMDVTGALKPGRRNLFAVRVYKKTSTSNLEKAAFGASAASTARPASWPSRHCMWTTSPSSPVSMPSTRMPRSSPPSASPARPGRISLSVGNFIPWTAPRLPPPP